MNKNPEMFFHNATSDGSEKPPWFEYVLNERLLDERLKNNLDASQAAILVSTFLHHADVSFGIMNDIRNTENIGGDEVSQNIENSRIKCLKSLASKSAASISWNLDCVSKYLPAKHAHALLSHLVKITTNNTPSAGIDLASVSPTALFAINLFCCWSLKFIVEESLPSRPPKVPNFQLPGLFDPRANLPGAKELVFKMLQEQESVNLLEKIAALQDLVADMPTTKCFTFKNEQEVHDWSHCIRIPPAEIAGQASYSLGCLFFLRQNYQAALSAFLTCHSCLKLIKNPLFMAVNSAKVRGYLKACRGVLKLPPGKSVTVHEAIKKSLDNQRSELCSLLVKDLEKRELSLSFRFELETKLHDEHSEKSKLYKKVLSYNSLRRILSGSLTSHGFVMNILKNNNSESLLSKTCSDICYNLPGPQQTYLKEFLVHLCMVLPKPSKTIDDLLDGTLRNIFTRYELELLESPSVSLPPEVDKCRLSFVESLRKDHKIANLEQELLTCYDADRVNEILDALKGAKVNPLFLFDKWREHSELKSVVRDPYASALYNVFLVKSDLCQKLGLHEECKTLLDHMGTMLMKSNFAKVKKILNWDCLKADFLSFCAETATPQKKSELLERAKQCLNSFSQKQELQINLELLTLSTAHLVNCEEYEFLSSTSNSNEIVMFGKKVGWVLRELKKSKNVPQTEVLFKSITIAVVTPPTLSLQGHINKDCFLNFVSLLSNEAVLSIIISGLLKLLRLSDESITEDVICDCPINWSSNNKTKLEREPILEALHFVLNHALGTNIHNLSWIRTQADLFYSLKQYHLSLRYFVHLGVLSTDYFSEPINRNTYGDQIYRKMIEACMNLKCFTQAAVLCQFLEKVDYSTAFKCISERPVFDEGEAYYGCIWDATLMEFIVACHKSNAEIEKMSHAQQLMKSQQMNGNRCSEAFREISCIKRRKFFRRMAQHYVGTVRLFRWTASNWTPLRVQIGWHPSLGFT